MANSANITAYADDATTLFTFKPLMRSAGVQEYREFNAAKSSVALARLRLSIAVQKNSLERRVKQTVLPIMEVASGGTADGFTAPPKVAHEVVVMTTVLAHPRATAQNIADAMKIHSTTVGTNAGTVGVANTWIGYSDQSADVLLNGVMPA